jgi:hypothetical protein
LRIIIIIARSTAVVGTSTGRGGIDSDGSTRAAAPNELKLFRPINELIGRFNYNKDRSVSNNSETAVGRRSENWERIAIAAPTVSAHVCLHRTNNTLGCIFVSVDRIGWASVILFFFCCLVEYEDQRQSIFDEDAGSLHPRYFYGRSHPQASSRRQGAAAAPV